MDDPYLDVSSRSKSGCGPTNDQAVNLPHNVPTSNAFPNNVLTKVSPNVVQQIVQHVHSSHIGASHSRQLLIKGERLVRYEVNAIKVGALETSGGTVL